MNNHFLAEVFAITKKKGGGKAPVISELAVTENGTYEAPTGVDGYSPVIVNVPTGGGGGAVLQSGANLVDYDGSLVQHYTKEEFLALTEMPSNPSHDGLVAQGWNWSLADAKTYVQKYGSLIIGQMYTTDTGDTRIYIHIDADTTQNRLTFYVRFTSSVADNVDIDWGDGTVETKGSITATNYPHTYVSGGDYIIKLKVNSGTISFVGNNNNSIYGEKINTKYYNRSRIRRVEIGNNVENIGNNAFTGCYTIKTITIPVNVLSIGNSTFQYCYSLASITLPVGMTSIGTNAFYNCYSIVIIAIPNSVTSIDSGAFYNCCNISLITLPNTITNIRDSLVNKCYSMTSFITPDSVTTISTGVFQECYSLASIKFSDNMRTIQSQAFYYCPSLTSITIPHSVTDIGSNAFSNCYGISEYHMLPTIPPNLSNADAFNNIASDCIIYVPYSADHSILAAYQSASKWSTYASYMLEEPQP